MITAEAAAVAAAHPGSTFLLGPAATRAEFGRLGRGARVLHVASHAAYRPDDPMASAIRLGDGWLTAAEVPSLNLAADLVVLSGCATGRATVTEGDDAMGLVRGFLESGAGCLVTSLWRVSDGSARMFMAEFHRRIAAGAPPSAALREAALVVRAKHPHPHDWAPFTLTSAAVRPRIGVTAVRRTLRMSKNLNETRRGASPPGSSKGDAQEVG